MTLEIIGEHVLNEDYRFIPLDGMGGELDLLEHFAQESKVAVAGSSKPLVLRKYGDEEKLRKIFEHQVGYMENVDEVKSIVKNTAEEFEGLFGEGSIIVLDKREGELIAYTLPYIGIRGGPNYN